MWAIPAQSGCAVRVTVLTIKASSISVNFLFAGPALGAWQPGGWVEGLCIRRAMNLELTTDPNFTGSRAIPQKLCMTSHNF
jgi:hypothetical protein